MPAVCHCCGFLKDRPLMACRACSMVPIDEDRAIAWLLGSDYLTPEELELVALRVRQGEVVNPSRELRRMALVKLGFIRAFEQFSLWQFVSLFIVCCLFTPMIGIAVWWGSRGSRPRMAEQAIFISGMSFVVTTVLMWGWIFVSRW